MILTEWSNKFWRCDLKVGILYFSGTGNTWYVAKSIKVALEAKAVEVLCHSIEEGEVNTIEKIESLIEKVDKVIVGYPIYGSVAPKIMASFLENMPSADDKSISVFTTVALASGDGPLVYKPLLESKGYTFESGQEFITSNNFNVPIFADVLKNGDEKKIINKNAKASRKAIRFAEALISNESIVQGDHLIGKFLGNTQRKHVVQLIKQVNESIYVKKDRCVGCKRCEVICPVGNIEMIDDIASIEDQCIACMRCYHFCPTKAINITEKSLDEDKWPRFAGPTKEYLPTLMKLKESVKNNYKTK